MPILRNFLSGNSTVDPERKQTIAATIAATPLLTSGKFTLFDNEIVIQECSVDESVNYVAILIAMQSAYGQAMQQLFDYPTQLTVNTPYFEGLISDFKVHILTLELMALEE